MLNKTHKGHKSKGLWRRKQVERKGGTLKGNITGAGDEDHTQKLIFIIGAFIATFIIYLLCKD